MTDADKLIDFAMKILIGWGIGSVLGAIIFYFVTRRIFRD